MISNNLQSLKNDSNISLEQSPVCGLARTMMNENPNIRTSIIDIGNRNDLNEYNLLFQEVTNNFKEDEMFTD